MTKEELKDVLRTGKLEDIITIDALKNKEDRILISGYTCDRSTFITAIEHGEIVTYLMDTLKTEKTYLSIRDNWDLRPSKRVYPHKSDYEFCKLLHERDVSIGFTTFVDEVLDKE